MKTPVEKSFERILGISLITAGIGNIAKAMVEIPFYAGWMVVGILVTRGGIAMLTIWWGANMIEANAEPKKEKR